MKIVWCWPVWILSNVLFAILFYERDLWGLFLVQFLFAALSVLGYREWLRARPTRLVASGAHA